MNATTPSHKRNFGRDRSSDLRLEGDTEFRPSVSRVKLDDLGKEPPPSFTRETTPPPPDRRQLDRNPGHPGFPVFGLPQSHQVGSGNLSHTNFGEEKIMNDPPK